VTETLSSPKRTIDTVTLASIDCKMKKLLLFLTLISTLELVGQQTDTLRIGRHYYYLADLDLRTIAERIMNDELLPSDNFITFRILDSLSSPNVETRKYFLPVFNKILLQADGALAEVMGTPIIEYLKQYPKEFISTTESDKLYELYSNYAAYELYFSDDYKSAIAELERTALSNCQDCPNSEHIKNFLKLTAKKVEEI
jgi:hypothetical protein